jgi:putative membrane protein
MMMTGLGMGLGGVWMIIFWAVIIGGGIWLLATLFPKSALSPKVDGDPEVNSLAILKQRYARGELSKEEFETIRRDLEQP